MRYGMPPKSIDVGRPDAAHDARGRAAARSTTPAIDEQAFDRERASVIVGASGGTGDVGSQYGLRSELPRFNGDAAGRRGRPAARVDRGLLRRHPAQRHRRAGRQPVQLRRRQLHRRRGLRLVAGGGLPGRPRAGRRDAATSSSPAASTRCRARSATSASARRRRCRRAAAAAPSTPSADGIVISEGIAMVALKRLADAERDGDRIYAVIKGVGGGSDGNAKGLTAPLPAGQLRAMRRAYARPASGRRASACSRRTAPAPWPATAAELQSTTRLIGEDGGAPRQAAIGSVKTMIGHTKATAGIAGLIKAALALHHRVLPPHRGVDKPNCRSCARADEPALPASTRPMPWLAPGDVSAPRRGQRVRLRRHQLPRRDGGVPRRVPRLAVGRRRPIAGPPSCCSGATPTARPWPRASPTCAARLASARRRRTCATSPRAWRARWSAERRDGRDRRHATAPTCWPSSAWR